MQDREGTYFSVAESMALVVLGALLGLAATLTAGQLVAAVSFGFTPTGVWTIGARPGPLD